MFGLLVCSLVKEDFFERLVLVVLECVDFILGEENLFIRHGEFAGFLYIIKLKSLKHSNEKKLNEII